MGLGGKTILVVVLNMKIDQLCVGWEGLSWAPVILWKVFLGPQNQKQRLCSALLAVIFGCSPLKMRQAQFHVFGGAFLGAAMEALGCNPELRMSSAS